MRLYHVDHTVNREIAREINFLRGDDLAGIVAQAYVDGVYVHVADIDGTDPEIAWTATQNGVLSDSWSQEPPKGVHPVEPSFHLHDGRRYGRKSSDIGDLVEIDGTWHMVDTFGFKDITDLMSKAIGGGEGMNAGERR